MKHLITGGSGYLGSMIAAHFFKRGDDVTVIDVIDDVTRDPGIKFLKGSVLDRSLVRQGVANADIVHHTAALVPLTKSGKDFFAVNVNGSAVVAEEAADANVKAFIHLSSSAIFGAPTCPVTNNSPLMPLEVYGQSKLEGEKAVQSIARLRNMRLISVRPRTILGPGRLGIFQILFDWIKDDVDIFVIGNGKNKIQFIHTEDLIDAYMTIYDAGCPGFFNVGTDRFGTLKDDLESLCLAANSRSKVRALPASSTIMSLSMLDKLGCSPLAPWHYLTYGQSFYFDLTPLVDLGWKPKYSNSEMLHQSYSSFIANDRSQGNHRNSPHRRPVKQQILWLLKQVSRYV